MALRGPCLRGWMAMAIACLWSLCLGCWPSVTAADPFSHVHGNFSFDRRLLELDDETLKQEMRRLLDDVATLRGGRRRELISALGVLKSTRLTDVASCAAGIYSLAESRGNPYLMV